MNANGWLLVLTLTEEGHVAYVARFNLRACATASEGYQSLPDVNVQAWTSSSYLSASLPGPQAGKDSLRRHQFQECARPRLYAHDGPNVRLILYALESQLKRARQEVLALEGRRQGRREVRRCGQAGAKAQALVGSYQSAGAGPRIGRAGRALESWIAEVHAAVFQPEPFAGAGIRRQANA